MRNKFWKFAVGYNFLCVLACFYVWRRASELDNGYEWEIVGLLMFVGPAFIAGVVLSMIASVVLMKVSSEPVKRKLGFLLVIWGSVGAAYLLINAA